MLNAYTWNDVIDKRIKVGKLKHTCIYKFTPHGNSSYHKNTRFPLHNTTISLKNNVYFLTILSSQFETIARFPAREIFGARLGCARRVLRRCGECVRDYSSGKRAGDTIRFVNLLVCVLIK